MVAAIIISAVYAPSNMLITAAGNLSHERLVDLAQRALRERCRRGEPLPPDQPPATHARIALRNKKSLEQVHVCLGVPSYPLPHEERFACYVLNTMLGGGMSSRLFQNIRERQGLAYAVFSELNPVSRHRLPVDLCGHVARIGAARWWNRSSRNSAS